jgi:hypothetical protein
MVMKSNQMAVLGPTNLTGCNSIPDFIAGGSLVTFQQTSAPTSWTKQTTHNNKALRVVSGTASSGGSTAFTSVFTSRTPTGSVSVSNAAVTLSTAQLASHNHSISGNTNLVTNFPQGQSSSLGHKPLVTLMELRLHSPAPPTTRDPTIHTHIVTPHLSVDQHWILQFSMLI